MEQKRKVGRPKGTPKTGGRKPGVKNKVSNDLRSAVNDLLDLNWSSIQKDIKSLKPFERLNYLERLLSYSLPKLSSVSNEITLKNKIEVMNEDQLLKLAEAILNESEQNG